MNASRVFLPILALTLVAPGSAPASTCDFEHAPHYPPNFTMHLLPGYRFEKPACVDTICWRIWKPGGLDIVYETTHLVTPDPIDFKPVESWVRKCDTDVRCSRSDDKKGRPESMSVGFPDDGSFFAKVKSKHDIDELLSMVLTYAPGTFDRTLFVSVKTLERTLSRRWLSQCGAHVMEDALSWRADDVVRLLARAGVDVNGHNSSKTPFLFQVLNSQSEQMVRTLFDMGATPVQRDEDGKPFVPTWVGGDDLSMLALFVEHGLDVNAQDRSGTTTLMFASLTSQPKNVAYLLDRRASADLRDNQGNTALMKAVEAASLDVVELLLDRGAQQDVRNSEGKTASQIAEDLADRSKRLLQQMPDTAWKGDIDEARSRSSRAGAIVALLARKDQR